MTTSDQTRRNAVHRVVLDVARGGGGEITGHDAAPLDGIQAACVVEMEAQSLIRGYIQFARQEGYGRTRSVRRSATAARTRLPLGTPRATRRAGERHRRASLPARAQ